MQDIAVPGTSLPRPAVMNQDDNSRIGRPAPGVKAPPKKKVEPKEKTVEQKLQTVFWKQKCNTVDYLIIFSSTMIDCNLLCF